ncbi:transcription factor HES-4-B-like [Dreissena polymorpha]|uniref:Orange domain-containing protein n=1 Tax=Dreissena polymorpha TaxID=45954 RepID=A0A9D4ERU7_DREPO|nr:transcription factor HES-4-B-like [Dreissena polymorpha]KAH3785709.1 hypothetical protein DPMN_163803 [Dreissena polymorpha]
MTRVDKADILDLTVLHLQQLQQPHRSVSMATELAAYQIGFQACVREVMTYLTSQKYADMKTIKALSDHLQATQHVPQRCVRNQTPVGHQTSTPVRMNDVSKTSTYTLNTLDFSLNTSISLSSNESTSDSCYSSMNVSSTENSDVISEGDVSIGYGEKIGHMFKETLWRPF